MSTMFDQRDKIFRRRLIRENGNVRMILLIKIHPLPVSGGTDMPGIRKEDAIIFHTWRERGKPDGLFPVNREAEAWD